MTKTIATVPTEHGWKYVQQLCKHWSHKLEVDLGDQKGTVKFDNAIAVMTCDEAGLTVTIEAASEDLLERFKGVVSSHLDRFAFREAPLPFDWKPA
ncbi:DUF2218 domain-containing protein [Agrobacterium vitis]|uniref:DUF2218 domain-containing protein n=1 Tax=Agrobacterium vitis TaxID=373 RepID=A0AAE4WIR0_AGRVI|nr:DUF2218 domain-containing protein [Agrobacterium vitis]MCF1500502.1 DUF2218 domain-containing protein [Allorhizobium sp. Av2]MCM2442762.1 DUF2218 domain-containing protein [Agrobacterium vitis]MUZ60463.1 DUF2218 domain-containing protein [Agrobacterium vitis]MVA68484.1 DUF2218 domain-containing protein [Agrobacterium vitis]MVA88950.1 DUF2218 domain-containing protein [Agrobacterium vitis]